MTTTKPHDRTDLPAAPVAIAIDERLQELGKLSRPALKQRITLEPNMVPRSRDEAERAVLESEKAPYETCDLEYEMSVETMSQEILPTDGNPHGRLVVGIDGSPGSLAALRWAVALAEHIGSLLDIVGVWDGRGIRTWITGEDGVDLCDAEVEAHQAVADAIDEVFDKDRPRGLRTFVLPGKPHQILVEHAAGAGLLVVGNRGRGGLLNTGIGSVSHRCAAHATCPVLVVHEDDPVLAG